MTKKLRYFCTLLLMMVAGVTWAEDIVNVTDVIKADKLAATNTTYADFSGVTITSKAVYAGNSAKDSSGNIQLRSKNSNSGIVSTTSGGTISSIKINVSSGSNTIDVYGRNTAYTSAEDLYGDSPGTLLGSLSATGTITVTGNYAYVGIRSRSNSVYLSSIELEWAPASETPTVAIPNISPGTGTYTCSQTVSITCETPEAAIYYALDGNDPTTSSTLYTDPITISADATLKAIAVASNMENSAVATANYTIVDPPAGEPITDVIKADKLAATGTTYTNFSGVTIASKAVYAGNSAKDSSGNIQLRSKNSNSGIVSTTSGGTISSITINVANGSNTIEVYGRNTAYTSAEDLYGDSPGTLIGSLSATGTINVEGSYAYVGIRTKNGAVYISSIEFKWIPASETPKAATPSFSLGSGTYTGSQTVSITCETSGAAIYYTLDGNDPTTSSTLYSEPISISADATLKAIAVADNMENSAVATANYIIIDPNTPGASEATAYTVAEAIEFIKGLTGTSAYDVYVKGTVSYVQSYSDGNKSITYWISDDGERNKEMEVYNGKGVNKAGFDSKDDLHTGDEVMVCGKVKSFSQGDNTIYEFDSGNYLVSLTSNHKQSAGLAFDKSSLSVELNGEFTEPTLTNPHSVTVTYSSTDENVATVGTDGTLTIIGAGKTTIKASFAGNDEYEEGEASYTLTVKDPLAKGGRLNPYTVAAAITFIGTLEGETSDEVYVKGIISQIDEVSTEHGNATYWISDNGTTTTTQLEVYRGKYLEKAAFTAADQIALGYNVTVCGKVKLFTNSDNVSTPEFTQNNYIYELTIPSISTGINQVEKIAEGAAIYNLNGVRVNKVQKGVYVVNGKKVVIK